MRKVFKFLIFIIFIFTILFGILKIGFSISSLDFNFLKIEQLYIKLDKKLIIRAENLALFLQEEQEKQSDFSVKKLVNIAKKISFIQEIDLKNLEFAGARARILFKDDEFLIDHDEVLLRAVLSKQDQFINADIKEFFLKKINAYVDGNASLENDKELYHFEGELRAKDFNTKIDLAYKKGKLEYNLSDFNISNVSHFITTLASNVKVPKGVQVWLGDNIKSDFYFINSLRGTVDTNKNKLDLSDMKAHGFAKNVSIRLYEDSSLIRIPFLKLVLDEQRLDFIFDKASFEGQDISASKVHIYKITEPKQAGIFILLKSNTLKFDEKIKALVSHYGAKIPFIQLNGTLKSELGINIAFIQGAKASLKGEFELENSKLDLLEFFVKKGRVHLENDIVLLEEFEVENEFLQSALSSRLDFKEKNGFFDLNISKLKLDNALDLSKKDLRLDFNFDENLSLESKELGLEAKFSEGLLLTSKEPNLLKTYSPLLKELRVQNIEDFNLSSQDLKKYKIQARGVSFDLGLFKNDKTKYNKDSFEIIKDEKTISINTQSALIQAFIDEKQINIKARDLAYVYSGKSDLNAINFTKDFVFSGSNISIELENIQKKLVFDSIEASAKGGLLLADAQRKTASFDLLKNANELRLKITNANDANINEFFDKNLTERGSFNLLVEGKDSQNFEAKIWFKDTYLKEAKSVNQLISFIDTVPSLLIFKPPTFNNTGLKVEEGVIDIQRQNELVRVKALSLKGDSLDILGLGFANLELNTLNLDLELKTLKSASSIVSKIPIVNQVVLGKNREISTNLKVDGSLANPNFRTQIVQDIIKSPFNLIRNIIEMPSTWFE